MFRVILILILTAFACSDVENKSDEEYIDSVINLLLNGDSSTVDVTQPSELVNGEQPVFKEGVWKCGNCDVIDESQLVYSEANEVDTNGIEDLPTEVQVGLTMDGMRCVTVSAGADSAVRRVAGTCAGARVTLAVSSAQHFIVRVYK